MQVGTIIEMLTARKGELLEVDQVDQGFGAAAHNPDTQADGTSSSSGAAGAAGTTSSSSGGSGSSSSSRQRLVFEVPARGMIGFKSLFASITRGEGLMQRAFSRYDTSRHTVQCSVKWQDNSCMSDPWGEVEESRHTRVACPPGESQQHKAVYITQGW